VVYDDLVRQGKLRYLATFLGVSEPAVRSDDLRDKPFSTRRLGYDKTQVEAFVEAAGLRLAAMESTDGPEEPLVSERHFRRVGRVGRLNKIRDQPPSLGGLRNGGGEHLPERSRLIDALAADAAVRGLRRRR
jgi:DivIVA domain-containing protein